MQIKELCRANWREEKIVDIELERSKLNRDKSAIILDKSVLMYFSFLALSIVGFIRGYINNKMLNMLVTLALTALVVGSASYIYTIRTEEERLDGISKNIKKGE
jgi:uncharacterized membrane-anchored protein